MIYESEEDRLNQERTIQVLAQAWRCLVIHTPTLAAADFLMLRDNHVCAVAEFKRRRNPMNQYPTLTVDESKIDKLVLLGKMLQVPSLIIIQWDDALAATNVRSVNGLKRGHQTRNHIRDAGDVNDRVYHIPTAVFQPINQRRTP